MLAIALNRLTETRRYDEEALQIEFEELIERGENLVVTIFEPAKIDALLLVDDEEPSENEGDTCTPGAVALLQPGELARIVPTDIPFKVPIAGHVTSQTRHREFAMASD